MSKLTTAIRILFKSPRFFLKKIGHEMSAPTTTPTRGLRKAYTFCFPKQALYQSQDRILFVYDTLLMPVTFDFLNRLYYSDYVRRHAAKARMDVLVVTRPMSEMLFDEGYIEAIGEHNVAWRVNNILLPLTRLFPSVDRVFCLDADVAYAIVAAYNTVHPHGYSHASPRACRERLDDPDFKYVPVLRVSPQAREIIEAYFPLSDSRKLVTITLRSYGYIDCRNSDLAEWKGFAEELDSSIYRVVFVPDASSDGVGKNTLILPFESFDVACWNLELRAALYQRAWMNMGVVCGPLMISALMENVITVVIERAFDYPSYYADGARAQGITPGIRPSFYSSTCHWVEGRDDRATIRKAFSRFQVASSK